MTLLGQTGGRAGGSCTAALFLKPFAHGIEGEDGKAPTLKWAHIDIAGSMEVCLLGFLECFLIDAEGF